MLHTLAHELVHHIREQNAEEYKVLADFLMEQYGKKGVSVDALVRRQIEKAEASDRKISYAEAHEEVIADSMETMLTDGKAIEKLQMLQAKDPSLFERIKSAIAELIAKIKKAYKNVKPETLEGQIVASMLDEYETIQQMFVKALAGASENFKNAEVTKTKNTAETVKFSIKEMGFEEFDKQTLNNIKMRKGVVLNSVSELKSHIERALQNPQEKVNCYLGVISPSVKSKIEEDVGQKLFEENKPYTFVISYDDIQHISEHFNSVDKMVSEVLKVYEIIKDYDSVEFEIGKSNAKKLIFDKSYSDYDYRTVEIVSKSKSSLDLVTFFITKNNIKGSQSVPPATRGSLQRGSASDNTVPQNGTDVNTSISEKGVKYSYAGREAKTSDIKTLEAAIRLEDVGKTTSEEIRQQTGWFRGMDGKWRFEISDRDIEIDTTGKFHTNPDVRRYMELFDKVFVNMNASEEEATELRGLDKNLKGVSFEPRTLGELIKHDKLFAAYPQLKEISVHFADIDERGIYDPISKILVLQSKLKLDKSKLEKTLIHEIQHAIQDIEGFASGSSPDSWQVAGVSKEDAYGYYERTAGEIEARDSATRSWRTDEARKEKRPDIDRTDVVFADGGESYSIVEPFTDEEGNSYDGAVLLDTNFFDGLSPYNWSRKLSKYVFERSSNNPFILPIIDENGDRQQLQFAKPNERVTKNGKSNHKVLDELSYSKDNISKLAVVHIDEIVSISEENNPYYTNEHNHQWLDERGWLHRNAYVINNKNGNVFNLTLDIAKTRDGRFILFATKGKIKKVGNVQLNSLKIKGSGLNSNYDSSISNFNEKVKQKQFEIIEKVNPAPNSYLTWIRKVEDIKTLLETLEDSEWSDYDEFNPDLTRRMLEEAIEKGEITVYSSYQIKQGTFVSPSYMEAESYSGNGKVYEKTVKIEDVAWIDPTQGMYANIDEKYSDRDPDALTPRNLLANALEESAVHEVEKKKLAEYKENIGKLYEKEQELYEVRKEIKELSFAPGKKDTAKIKKLQEKAVKLSNSVTFYDKKLLNLESTSFLKNVLEREKQKAIKRQKEKDAERLKAQKEKALQREKEITERYQASRKKAVESRNKTAMRNKIKRVVNELNQYLLHGTKDKHVMDNMKKVVAEALNIIDMDTVGADERVERYNQLIAEATDTDVIASLTETRDRIQGQGDKLHEKLMSLKNDSRFKTQLCKFIACK